MSLWGHLLWCFLCTSSKAKAFNFRTVACSRISKRKDTTGLGWAEAKNYEKLCSLKERRFFTFPSLPLSRLVCSRGGVGKGEPETPINCQLLCSLNSPFQGTPKLLPHIKSQISACGTDGQAKKSGWLWASSYLGPKWLVYSKWFHHCEAIMYLKDKLLQEQEQSSTLLVDLHINLTLQPIISERPPRVQSAWDPPHVFGTLHSPHWAVSKSLLLSLQLLCSNDPRKVLGIVRRDFY